ncbi:hypothetical protein EIC27_04240 [Candidatus Aquarickettsia rohweri]|uniref:Flagellar cap protein n=2 Tax=Candidatus Aquarickettsia rohweri TaxID=2602574 RepID=A0A3R9XM46_9RICK|nr:hypothetical protein EIC27_04240 [Candidatus Aquarickettsia rohweri]
MSSMVNAINNVVNPQENSYEAKALEQAQKPVKKVEDELILSSKTISGLGQWKTLLENLKDTVSEFSTARFGSNNIFDRKKVVGDYDKYATIRATPGTKNQQISFEIISLAEGQIIQTNDAFKPDDKIAEKLNLNSNNKKEVTFTILDNGLKSENVEADFKVAEGKMFSPGKFTIGTSAEIEIKAGDTLEDIVKKINNITREFGEAQNPHIITTIEKDSNGKKYIWIRSDEKHHGIQNKFEISGDAIKGIFEQKNNEIKVDFDENTKVRNFVSQLRQSAKKANIEVSYNPQSNSSGQIKGRISLKSLLTGVGNEIKISSNFKSLFNTDSPLQQPKDSAIKVDKEIINSKTNEIKTERLTIELKDDPTRKESANAKEELAQAEEELANAKEESAKAEEPTKTKIAEAETKIAQAKTKIAQADSKITKAEAENQIFNLSIENNTEGLVEKFERLAKVYNEFSTFVLTHSLEVEDPETYSKPADISSLYNFKGELNSITEQISKLFNKFDKLAGYRSKEETSDLGIEIKFRADYTHPPSETKNGEEQIYKPAHYYEMVVDKEKLKNAFEENFEEFVGILSQTFDSKNMDFKPYNNYKNYDFETNEVKNLEYEIDYSEIKYFNNVSKNSPSANTKINEDLSEKSFFLIKDSKIFIDKDTTYSSLVDKINKYSRETGIKAYLLSDNKILSTKNPSGSEFKIALSLFDDKEIKDENALEYQNDLRNSLELFDPNNALKGLFSSTASSLDIETKKDLVDGKIPQITIYDTSDITAIQANLNDDSIEELPSYLKLLDKSKLESGGIIRILPKTFNGNKKIDLENFEVAYLSSDSGKSIISAKQGIVDTISNLINEYTKFGGVIDRYTELEELDKSYKEHTLSYEKQAYQYKKAQIERDSHKIKAQEIKTRTHQELLKQLNKRNDEL